jgi:hypothetical protein
MRFSAWCDYIIEILGFDAVYADFQDQDFLNTEYRQHILQNFIYRQNCTVSQTRKQKSGPYLNNSISIFVKFCAIFRWIHFREK